MSLGQGCRCQYVIDLCAFARVIHTHTRTHMVRTASPDEDRD